MLKGISIISIFICFVINSGFAQFSADVDGNLSVSPVNGNLTYSYPLSNNSIDGFPISFSLNYTNNATFVSLAGYNKDPQNENDGWSKMSFSKPAWIMDVNGFAINVLAYNTNIMHYNFSLTLDSSSYPNNISVPNYDSLEKPDDNSNGGYKMQIPLIEGYDFCNRMELLTEDYDQDIIKILLGNGGVLELKNPLIRKNASSNNDPDLYTGYYYENSINPEGFAVVSFDTTHYWPSYIKSIADGREDRNSFKPRVLRYYKGDGIEYVFREIVAPYGLRLMTKVTKRRENIIHSNYPRDSILMPANVTPTIFYLEEINSDMKNLAVFKREWHNFPTDSVEITRGRAFITEFANNKITIGNEDLKIQTLDRTISCKIRDIENKAITRGKETFNNVEQEINTPFPDSTSFYDPIYQVIEISDPENRKTTFEYSPEDEICRIYTGFPYPFESFEFFSIPIKKIKEPTRTLEFDYHFKFNDDIYVTLAEATDTTGRMHYDISRAVKERREFENSYGSIDTIRKVNYYFSDNYNSSTHLYDRQSVQIITDCSNDSKDSTESIFTRAKCLPFVYNPNENRNYLQTLLPIKNISYLGDKKIQIETEFKNDSLLGGYSRFFYRPYSTVSKTIRYDNNANYITDKAIVKYSFVTGTIFPADSNLTKLMGEKVFSSTSYKLNPSNNDTILKNRKEYFHLDLINLNSNRIDTLWNKVESIEFTDSVRILNNNFSTINLFDIKTSSDWYLPPIFNIEKSNIKFDENDQILHGKLYEYSSQYSQNSNGCRRGALLNEYIIGKFGNDTILAAKYDYTGGRKRNLLYSLENAFGSKNISYYDYFDINSLGNDYPNGNKLHNNDSISQQKVYKSFYEFESPVANDILVRKYKPLIGYYTDTLRTFLEKNYYGQNSAIIEPNRWYYSNEYDKNGRILYSWEPFDYPVCDGNSSIIGTKIPFFNKRTRIIKTQDDVNGAYQTVTHPSYAQTQVMSSTLVVGNTIDAVIPFGNNQIQDNIIQVKTNSSTLLDYIASNNDVLHSGKTISELYFQFAYAGNYMNECMMIKISTDRFSLEKRFVLGCPALQNLEDTISYSSPSGIPMLKVDLLPIMDSLRNLSSGSTVTFEISSMSIEGQFEIVNLSEDQFPGIIVKYYDCDPHKDYTRAFTYNDSSRTTAYSSKIDDGLHTSNLDWQKTYSSKDGRYFGNRSLFGANNRLLKNEMLIGHPVNYTRIDSNLFYYSGNYQKISSKDNLGYQDSIVYDKEGRVIRYLNYDNSAKCLFYYVLPDTVNDQSFNGLINYQRSFDEKGRKIISLYDSENRLRKTILDSGNYSIITKYNYDILGNLTNVIHPNNDTTFYVYDDFWRTKFKVNPDIDTLAYAYDELSRVRFSQSKVQKQKNTVSFLEYDDLNRVTVSGEATIDTVNSDYRFSSQWLTEILNPNIINYSGYSSSTDIVNVNKTLWQSSSALIPGFWGQNYLDTTRAFPILLDTLENLFKDLYLMHPVNYYYYTKDTIASTGNFENISAYPEFINVVNHYDELPDRTGIIWSSFPEKSTWDSIVPYHPWDRGDKSPRNLKGRKSAVAYRDNGNEPFHYLVYSYDPRGRIQSLLRYTENLGFDAVYYTYNSLNQIINIRVADPIRQHVTWYGYDNNGRVDSIWTVLTSPGTGLGTANLRYPTMPQRPGEADIVYTYDKRGNIDTLKFLPAHLTQIYSYNARGWIDSLIAKDNYNQLFFKQSFERDDAGNITKQISQHRGRQPLTQTYQYDGINRLTKWSDQTDSLQYFYDYMGNRQKTIKNLIDTSVYNYSSPVSSNRLMSFTENTSSKFYHYDGIGAVDAISKLTGIDTVLKEKFTYLNSGRVKFYTKSTNELFNYLCSPSPFTRTFDNSYKWQYRNSQLGDREQKRLLYSPHGDSVCHIYKYYHDWTYYLLGPGGEQLAVYNGVQVANNDTLNHSGRRVYMYSHSYIAVGGSLVTLSDSTKQFNIFDNLGSCRSVISVKGIALEVQSIDYKPFGDTLNSMTESRIGYIGKERDKENSYFAMGTRQYDCTTGRFLSIDPLFEKFREQTPYQYAFNNPVSFKDPTGLEPESEKGGEDRMLWTLIKEDMAYFDQVAASLASKAEEDMIRFQSMRQMIEETFAEIAAKSAQDDYKWRVLSRAFGASGGGGSGGSGGGDRTGGVKANNDDAKNGIKKSVENYYEEYVKFDDEGYVYLTEEGKNKAQDDKKSNFYKLFVLSENTRYIFNVFGVDKTDLFNAFMYFPKEKSYGKETRYSLADLRGQGIFLADQQNEGNYPYSPIGPVVYFNSKLITNDISKYVAEELYLHAYYFYLKDRWGHDNPKISETNEYYYYVRENSIRRRR